MKNVYRLIFLIIVFFACSDSYSQNWSMVWSDEFDSSSINGNNWTHETGGGGWGNNELEYYTNRTDNSYIQDGKLVIKVIKENYSGRSYTSARLKTQNKKFWKYGKVEARLKLPAGQGIWPAFWMLGQNINSVGWPKCGEIDIME
ncbi:glycoside hydrolase family 16 protein, partial [bacterium]